MSDQVWPEFRRWYELTMEEQRIYDQENGDDHNRLLDAIDEERKPLERAMFARQPRSLTDFAALAVVELRHAERRKDPEHDECRLLELGFMGPDPEHLGQGEVLIEALVKYAVTQNLLPRHHDLWGGWQCVRKNLASFA
jgi:hypothetical protein